MQITRLEVSYFRNLSAVRLSPGPSLNILYGANASGKTSLLEAIHTLCMGRSFRTLRSQQIVQHGHEALTVFAALQDTVQHRLGMQRHTDNRIEIRLDGQPLRSRAELVALLPLQLLTPDSINLLLGAPRYRRHYLDWLMFHVEQGFYRYWLDYQRLLKQRNSLLKTQQLSMLATWEEPLVRLGEALDAMRKQLLEQLSPYVDRLVKQLLPEQSVRFAYRQGWRQDASLAQALQDSLASDRRHAVTSVGPHRCDLSITTAERRPVTEVFSRGQLKLLVVALYLAQMEFLATLSGKRSLVLVDDLPAELDPQHRQLLLSLLHSHCQQVFITSTDAALLDYSAWPETKVFHVERGQIKEVV